MKPIYLLTILVILALSGLVARWGIQPAVSHRALLIGRWQAFDLPPMCFSWDYQFRADGTGTQFYDNGRVMGSFRWSLDQSGLRIFTDQSQQPLSAQLKFIGADKFELSGPSETIRFRRR